MTLEDSLTQVLYVKVGVNLGGSKVFVSEQLLNDAQVGSVLEQVGSKRVPQGVRRDGFCDAGRFA